MSDNPNKDICDMLIKLGEHERDVNGIIYKYHAYRKAAKALETYGKRVKSGAEAQKLSGIGPKIAAKINDFLQNGCDDIVQDSSSKEIDQATSPKLKSKSKKEVQNTTSNHSKSEEASSTTDDLIEEKFDKIYGMTKIDIMRLKIKGIKTIGDLRNNINIAELNEAQQICLEHYDDLRLKISRKEIIKFEKLISKTLNKLSNVDVVIEICGEFRRRIEECDKIDLLVIDLKTKSTDSDAEHKLKKNMKIIHKALFAEQILLKRLDLDGCHFVGIGKLEQSRPYRLINLHFVPKDQYICALFHLTGSDQFLERIHLHCIDRFILSSRTLRRIGQALVPGFPIKIKSEEELFDYIEHLYVEPKDRQ
ncbi:DNA polymerase beta-like [Dermatophagoides pteronyssinus]|uniref:DNA polymerase beta-like n=1 Tax=Dermatophagoides pteronyssinus TaxID=6956 RepID=UPI003F66B96D